MKTAIKQWRYFIKTSLPLLGILTLIAVPSSHAANVNPKADGLDQVQAQPLSGEMPFLDRFEPNTVKFGDLNGQNEWKASPNHTVQVQTNIVWEGKQAVLFKSETVTSEVSRIFNNPPSQVVWIDFHAIERGTLISSEPSDQLAVFLFDLEGRMIVQDGKRMKGDQWVTLTNGLSEATLGTWVRLTIKLDFDNQRWLICLNGKKVSENLGFGRASRDFHQFLTKGLVGGLDQFCVSTNTPPGLTLDVDLSQTCRNSLAPPDTRLATRE